MKRYILFCFFVFASCISQKASEDIYTVDLRVSHTHKSQFLDTVDRVEYIPLELTDDDDSLVDQILDISVTDNSIFILSTKQDGVIQFNHNGKFIRKIAKTGEGPGETQMIMSISIDEENDILYVSQPYNTLSYSLDGKYIGTMSFPRILSRQYHLHDGIMAEIGGEYTPLGIPGMFGLGVFSLQGDTIDIKNDFADGDLPSVATAGLKQVYSIDGLSGHLCYVACNDTIFRLTANGISPAFYIHTGNSKEAKANLTDVRSRDPFPAGNYMIRDFFETTNYFYLRALCDGDMYLYTYNKKTGETFGGISEIAPHEIFDYNRSMTGVGMKNNIDGGLPVWITKSYLEKKMLLQFNTGSEIRYFIEKGEVTELDVFKNMDEESNPLIVAYYLK